VSGLQGYSVRTNILHLEEKPVGSRFRLRNVAVREGGGEQSTNLSPGKTLFILLQDFGGTTSIWQAVD